MPLMFEKTKLQIQDPGVYEQYYTLQAQLQEQQQAQQQSLKQDVSLYKAYKREQSLKQDVSLYKAARQEQVQQQVAVSVSQEDALRQGWLVQADTKDPLTRLEEVATQYSARASTVSTWAARQENPVIKAIASFVGGFTESLLTVFNPLAYYYTFKFLSDPVGALTRVWDNITSDPVASVPRLAGGLAGGYAFGKLVSPAPSKLRVAYGEPETKAIYTKEGVQVIEGKVSTADVPVKELKTISFFRDVTPGKGVLEYRYMVSPKDIVVKDFKYVYVDDDFFASVMRTSKGLTYVSRSGQWKTLGGITREGEILQAMVPGGGTTTLAQDVVRNLIPVRPSASAGVVVGEVGGTSIAAMSSLSGVVSALGRLEPPSSTTVETAFFSPTSSSSAVLPPESANTKKGREWSYEPVSAMSEVNDEVNDILRLGDVKSVTHVTQASKLLNPLPSPAAPSRRTFIPKNVDTLLDTSASTRASTRESAVAGVASVIAPTHSRVSGVRVAGVPVPSSFMLKAIYDDRFFLSDNKNYYKPVSRRGKTVKRRARNVYASLFEVMF